jgi:hypothetical protein
VVTPLVIRERTPVHLPRLKGSLIESSTGCGLVSRVPCACGKSRWAFVHFRPSACRKASAARPSFCSHQQIDFFFRELLEGLELVGGMHVFSGNVVVQADLAWVVCSIDDARRLQHPCRPLAPTITAIAPLTCSSGMVRSG